jgi:CheY-like chemotaxis protein
MAKNVLVIDDDQAVRGAFKLILEDDGYTVREAENGLQGIEMVRSERPDLIFLDLRMPGIDGVETLRRLKAVDNSLNIYIVTAFASDFMEQLKVAHDEGLQFEMASKPLSSAQIRNIAQVVRPSLIQFEERSAIHHKLELTLYVVSLTKETRELVDQLSERLTSLYEPGYWIFEVVEVLGMPERALEKEVFATPMLVREMPKPVLRLLGDLSRVSSVVKAITLENQASGIQTMII